MNQEYTKRLEKIEDVLRSALPSVPSEEWKKNAFAAFPGCVTNELLNDLIKPCSSLIDLGGKRWRPLLLVLCAELAGAESSAVEKAYTLVPLVEFVHTASLIHDDIEDGADMRRGKPAAHITHGLDTAVNAASWLYFLAPVCIDRLETENSSLKLKLYQIYTTELRRLHLGQSLDITWHKNNTTVPTPQQYSAMVRMKTGTLASLSAITGILAGGGTEEQAAAMGEAAADIGVSFQILDDVINITEGNKGKRRGDDIVEGKKSLPVLLHLQRRPDDFAHIMSLFEQAKTEGIESPAVEQCINLLASTDSAQAAKNYASELLQKALQTVKSLYPGHYASLLIEELFASMMR